MENITLMEAMDSINMMLLEAEEKSMTDYNLTTAILEAFEDSLYEEADRLYIEGANTEMNKLKKEYTDLINAYIREYNKNFRVGKIEEAKKVAGKIVSEAKAGRDLVKGISSSASGAENMIGFLLYSLQASLKIALIAVPLGVTVIGGTAFLDRAITSKLINDGGVIGSLSELHDIDVGAKLSKIADKTDLGKVLKSDIDPLASSDTKLKEGAMAGLVSLPGYAAKLSATIAGIKEAISALVKLVKGVKEDGVNDSNFNLYARAILDSFDKLIKTGECLELKADMIIKKRNELKKSAPKTESVEELVNSKRLKIFEAYNAGIIDEDSKDIMLEYMNLDNYS